MQISEEVKDKITNDCELLYSEFKNLLLGKNAMAALIVTSTLYLSLCRYAGMNKEDILNKTSEAWDLHLEEEENHEKVK